jgi:hypothetical protein
LSEGAAIETAMIGRDGHFGAALIMDDRVTLNSVVMQVGGACSLMERSSVSDIFQNHPEFRKAVLGYDQFVFAQAQQTAACNITHHVQPRLCKWLSRMHDLAGADLQ